MQGDAALVEGLRGRGPAGLGPVYDAYADRLVGYARTLLRDTAAAEDAVHDALLVALARIDQLRDPDRLRPWLFAITRNECLRHLRATARFTDDEEAIGMLPSSDADLDVGVRREETAQLVDQAMGALNPADRDLLALALQHDLDGAEVARMAGRPANEIHARLSRARTQLATAVTALLLVRGGGRHCPGLAQVLAGEGSRLTPLLRKRVARHARTCETCEERGRAGVALVLPAAGLPVVLAAPSLGLRERLLSAAADPSAVQAAADGAGPFAADGFPMPIDFGGTDAATPPAASPPESGTPPSTARRALLAGAAALVLVGGVVGAALGLASRSSDAAGPSAEPTAVSVAGAAEAAVSAAPVPGPTAVTELVIPTSDPAGTASATGAAPAAASTTPGTTPRSGSATSGPSSIAPADRGGAGQTAAPSRRPTARPTRTPTPTASPTTSAVPAPAPPPPAPPVVTAADAVDLDRAADGSFTRCDGFRLRVTATTTGDVTSVTAAAGPSSVPLTPAGAGTWTGEVALGPGEYPVAVTAVGPDGSADRSLGTVLHICPG